MSRDSFQSKVTEALNQLIQQTPDRIWRTLEFLTELVQGSQFPTAFNTDWLIEI
jgi:hypothetical protein